MEKLEKKQIKQICKEHKLKFSVMRDIIDLHRNCFKYKEIAQELCLARSTITKYMNAYKQTFPSSKKIGIKKIDMREAILKQNENKSYAKLLNKVDSLSKQVSQLEHNLRPKCK